MEGQVAGLELLAAGVEVEGVDGVHLLLAPSIKAALDRDWSDPAQKAGAVKRLVIENLNFGAREK